MSGPTSSMPPYNSSVRKRGLLESQQRGIQIQPRTNGALISNKNRVQKISEMPGMPENDVTNQQNLNIHVLVQPLKDESQKDYDTGDVLFVKDPRKTVGTYGAVYGLQNLNNYMERTKRNFDEREKLRELQTQTQDDQGDNDLQNGEVAELSFDQMMSGESEVLNPSGLTPANLRRKFPYIKNRDSFPLNVSEFAQTIHLLGIMWSDNDKATSSKRNLGVTMDGWAFIGNMFGDVMVGDQIGYIVKCGPSKFTQFIGLNGKASGNPTPGNFLQVRAHFEPHSKIPFQSTAYGNPGDNDLDYWDNNARIRTRKVGFVGEPTVSGVRKLNWKNCLTGEGVKDSKARKALLYCEGLWIPLGIVDKVTRSPTTDSLELAHRSTDHYGKLLGESGLIVQVVLNPQNQISTL